MTLPTIHGFSATIRDVDSPAELLINEQTTPETIKDWFKQKVIRCSEAKALVQQAQASGRVAITSGGTVAVNSSAMRDALSSVVDDWFWGMSPQDQQDMVNALLFEFEHALADTLKQFAKRAVPFILQKTLKGGIMSW